LFTTPQTVVVYHKTKTTYCVLSNHIGWSLSPRQETLAIIRLGVTQSVRDEERTRSRNL